jgi:hypothetical protein
MDDDLSPIAGQLQGYRPTDARRCSGHERLLVLEVSVLSGRHVCSPRDSEQRGLSVLFAHQKRTRCFLENGNNASSKIFLSGKPKRGKWCIKNIMTPFMSFNLLNNLYHQM